MKKRYWIGICVLGLLLLSFIPGLAPNRPIIQLPGEVLWNWGSKKDFAGGLFGKGFLNTQLAMLVTFVLIFLIAFLAKRSMPKNGEAPQGFWYGFFEMLYEMMYGYVEDAAGKKWAPTFFPYFMTFVLWVVIANWMGLIPGVDSIGKWETYGEYEGHKAEDVVINELRAENGYSYMEAFDKDHHVTFEAVEADVQEQDLGGLRRGIFLVHPRAADINADKIPDPHGRHHTYIGSHPDSADWTLVPYLRPAASDINFTLAVALISVIMTQFYGMKAQGMKYWGKFFTFPAEEISKNPLAILNPVVGLLEFVSEVFKIVSFAFRLLGNIFAGMVLLMVIGSLLPAGNLLFYFLEFGVGALQGVVFALLTLTFMKGATEHHH